MIAKYIFKISFKSDQPISRIMTSNSIVKIRHFFKTTGFLRMCNSREKNLKILIVQPKVLEYGLVHLRFYLEFFIFQLAASPYNNATLSQILALKYMS